MQERYKMPVLHSPEGKGAISFNDPEPETFCNKLIEKTDQHVAPSAILPCPTCKGGIFVREDQTIVSHYNGDGLRCSANETKFEPPSCAHIHTVSVSGGLSDTQHCLDCGQTVSGRELAAARTPSVRTFTCGGCELPYSSTEVGPGASICPRCNPGKTLNTPKPGRWARLGAALGNAIGQSLFGGGR